jgi:hypothetical protein
MSRWTLRILAPLALLAPLAGSAEAGVGDRSGGALSSFGRLSPVQTVQYDGDCWYDNGWSGPGYYPCGNEWNSGLGGAGPVAPIVVPTNRRHHRYSVVVSHPQAPSPVYPGAPSRRLGAGGVHASPGLHAGAPVSPRVGGGGFYGGLGAGAFHQFHAAGVPHIGAPASPGFIGGGGLHGLGGATGVHIGAPASPSFAGGGLHGVGGGGVFQGGGAALGQGGIGHR